VRLWPVDIWPSKLLCCCAVMLLLLCCLALLLRTVARRGTWHVADIHFLGGPHRSRPSWDPLTALALVRSASAAHLAPCVHCDGMNGVSPSGDTAWRPGIATNQTYLTIRKGRDGQRVAEQIDELLCRTPHTLLRTRPSPSAASSRPL
jgi:hypothetical protein